MKYSKQFRDSIIKKLLPPENLTIAEVVREAGISHQTIYNWIKKAERENENLKEAFKRIRSGKKKAGNNHGHFFHDEVLQHETHHPWEQNIQQMPGNEEARYREENARLQQMNRQLKNNLRLKEKALEEVKALLATRKP